jgi:hypothetical protein
MPTREKDRNHQDRDIAIIRVRIRKQANELIELEKDRPINENAEISDTLESTRSEFLELLGGRKDQQDSCLLLVVLTERFTFHVWSVSDATHDSPCRRVAMPFGLSVGR